MAAEFVIVPALIMGVLAGLYELFLVHADESKMGWFSHGFHALPTCIIFTFIAMNMTWAISLTGWAITENFWIDLGLRVLIGFVAMIKVKTAAAVIKGSSRIGEKLGHALLVGAFIAASPYIYEFVAPYLPSFLTI